LIGLIWY